MERIWLWLIYQIVFLSRVICKDVKGHESTYDEENANTVKTLKLYENSLGFDPFRYVIPGKESNVINVEILQNASEEDVRSKIFVSLTKENVHILYDSTHSIDLKRKIKNSVQFINASLSVISVDYCHERDECDTLTQDNLWVSFVSPTHSIHSICSAMVSQLKLDNLAVIYDENFDFRNKYHRFFENMRVRHTVRKMSDGISNNDIVKRFRQNNIFNYFLMGNVSSVRRFLEGVDCEYFRKYFVWTFILIDFVSGVASPKTEIGIDCSLDSDVAIFFAIPQAADVNKFFYLLQKVPTEGLSPFFEESDGILFQRDDHEKGNYIDFGYTILKLENSDVKQMCQWTLRNGTQLFCDENTLRVKQKKLYRIAVVVQPPFIMRTNENTNANEGNYTGYCVALIDKLAKNLNFDYELFEEKTFGKVNERNIWNGVVRRLIEKEADIGLGAMPVTGERESVIDFTIPYYDLVGISIMLRRKQPVKDLFRFLNVMETHVWLCIIGVYFATSFLMWILDWFSPYSYQNNREKYKDHPEKRLFEFKECLWFCLTSLTPQGGGEVPKCISARVVAATWWLFGFIVVASYTANLAAFFTITRLDKSINSLEDLDKQFRTSFAPIKHSSAYDFFERMANIEKKFFGVWKEISLNDSLSTYERSKFAVWEYPVSTLYTKRWHIMKKSGFPLNMNEVMRRMLNANVATDFAFIGDATDIKYLTLTRTNCDLVMVGEEMSKKPYAIAVQKGSPIKADFDNELLTLLSTRWLQDIKTDWWPKDQCEKYDDEFESIQFENIYGFFFVILCGIGLAVIVLLFEFFWFRTKHRIIRIIRDDFPQLNKSKNVDRTAAKPEKSAIRKRIQFKENSTPAIDDLAIEIL